LPEKKKKRETEKEEGGSMPKVRHWITAEAIVLV